LANHKWSIEDKLRAAMAYLITGNSLEAAKVCGIPDKTIRDWTRETWWADFLGECRKEKNEELDAAFTDILHLAVGEVKDRITEGDEVIDTKTGTKHRKKVSARDATLVAAVLVDKRAILRGEPTRISKTISEKDRLKTLAQDLEGVLGVVETDTGVEIKKDYH
jgi:hypothetical protein